jgi:hypothetical protein
MILLSILLLPLGISVLVTVTAWAERMLDRPARKRSTLSTLSRDD